MRVLRLFVMASIMLTASLSARAEVGLVAVESDGRGAEVAAANAEAALRTARVQIRDLADAVGTGFDSRLLLECIAERDACPERVAAAQVDWIVALSLVWSTEDGGEPSVIATGWLVDGREGRRLQADRRFCERCSSDERLAATVTELVSSLVAGERESQAPDTYLEVRTSPADATLAIDGHVVGPTGRAYRVRPGTVRVRIERDGFEPVTREVQIEPNHTKVVQMDLAERESSDETSGSPLLGWGAFGLGAGLTALGITWIAIDGPRLEDGQRLPSERASLVPGIVSAGVGAALLAGGALLIYRARHSDAGPRASVSIAPTPGGVSMGLAGTF